MRQVACTALSGTNAATKNGSKIDARQLFNASFQVVNADIDLDGTVKIQASNDNPPNGAVASSFTPTNWSDVPSASVAVSNGVPAAGFISLTNMSYTWLRVVLTVTTPGTSTTTVLLNAQGV